MQPKNCIFYTWSVVIMATKTWTVKDKNPHTSWNSLWLTVWHSKWNKICRAILT